MQFTRAAFSDLQSTADREHSGTVVEVQIFGGRNVIYKFKTFRQVSKTNFLQNVNLADGCVGK